LSRAYRDDPHIKRGGKVWINIYPDRPLTKKPAETRMVPAGSPDVDATSSPVGHVRAVRVTEPIAREAMPSPIHKCDEVQVRGSDGVQS